MVPASATACREFAYGEDHIKALDWTWLFWRGALPGDRRLAHGLLHTSVVRGSKFSIFWGEKIRLALEF